MLERPISGAFLLFCLLGCGSNPQGTSFQIPDGSPGIGFDDLRFSASLQRVLAPAGRTGTLALIAPDSGKVDLISGFSSSGNYDGGHDFGPTSVDEGQGFLFVTDRTAETLYVVDPASGAFVASQGVSSTPDYVRYVAPTSELWVSEPSAEQIEIFSLSNQQPPQLSRVGSIAISNGPESLVIDAARGRAYSHHWQASTVAIDLISREILGDWPNGCAASRGIEVDAAHGFVFAACNEGTVSVLDPANNGHILSTISKGAGYDVVGFNPNLRHLYLAGSACGCLTTLGVSSSGQLTFLGRDDAPSDTHCVTADDLGNAWICDPAGGRLWRVRDAHAATE
jgi:DNA-binding beta-propeller fold protein YncE